MKRFAAIIGLYLLLNLIVAEEKKMELIESNLDKLPCKIYFFKSWATYQHPVKPVDPIEYESALMRDGFYRAWLCHKSGQEIFSLFEGVDNKHSVSKILKPDDVDNSQMSFYMSGEKGELAEKIPANATINLSKFYVSLPTVDKYLVHIHLTKGISYKYEYDNSGRPIKAIITAFDGKVNTLDL